MYVFTPYTTTNNNTHSHPPPPTPKQTHTQRTKQELADIWWRNHLRRELSVVVGLFTGQYRTVTTCPTCQ